MKFLVLWQLDLALLSREMVGAVGDMPAYGARLERAGKLIARYHVVGQHGGAWIYEVESHEEFERLLGRAPVFNFARYTIHPLADMDSALAGIPPLQTGRDHAVAPEQSGADTT
ncbi:MAG: hypothetical protein M3443_07370 [Actinomycetota bacterium]|nr:hypothetical protein [Actinomycetota bacterium]